MIQALYDNAHYILAGWLVGSWFCFIYIFLYIYKNKKASTAIRPNVAAEGLRGAGWEWASLTARRSGVENARNRD